MLYDESRISFIICGLAAVLQAIMLIYGLQADRLPFAIGSIIATVCLFMMFFSLRVTISYDALTISYGLGLIAKHIPLEAIQRTEIQPNLYLTWVYDPSREHILRLFLRDGRKVVVGIGDARRMMEIVSARVRD